jgi:hypothetical protein
MEEYQDVFQSLGQLPGQYTIHLRKNAQPVIQPARRVPSKYRKQLQEQLYEGEPIITAVREATEWVSPTLLVNKPGKVKLRICIDPARCTKSSH